MQFCDATCNVCSRRFFQWWKAREANQGRALTPGEPSFTYEAVRSVGARRADGQDMHVARTAVKITINL